MTKGFILQTLKREKESTNDKRIRVGFTTSKKVGNAVERNRVRRRLREVARLYLPELAKEGYDYVLIGRTACLTYPFLKLVDDFKETLAQV